MSDIHTMSLDRNLEHGTLVEKIVKVVSVQLSAKKRITVHYQVT